MKLRTITSIAAVGMGLMLASPAAADQSDPELGSPVGMGFTLGGAFNDFTSDKARGFTSPGGGWEARYVVGTRTPIAAEAAYIGTANELNALGVSNNAVLMSNGVEGALRLNVLTDQWQPYVLAGLGWKHYNVTNTPTNTSDIRDEDDAVTVPLGAGLAYRYSNFIADARATFKPSFLADITRSGTDDDTALHNYGAQVNVGFEF